MSGDCYRVAATIATDHGLTLCHGEPLGQAGPVEGIRYGHAWVEDGDTVIDRSNGLNVRMLASAYYRLGEIDEQAVRRYSPDDARRMLLEHGHWGPWHEQHDPSAPGRAIAAAACDDDPNSTMHPDHW